MTLRGDLSMPERIDNRGTRMTVRPLTPSEIERWPDAEIAFTIHYEGNKIKAHALTTVEAAYTFARTIIRACEDAAGLARNQEMLRAFARYKEQSGVEGGE